MIRKVAAILAALALLTACGGPSKFEQWAEAVAKIKVDATNVTSLPIEDEMLALDCVTWSTASDATRVLAPAQLAKGASEQGFESTADDARAYLDAHCLKGAS